MFLSGSFAQQVIRRLEVNEVTTDVKGIVIYTGSVEFHKVWVDEYQQRLDCNILVTKCIQEAMNFAQKLVRNSLSLPIPFKPSQVDDENVNDSVICDFPHLHERQELNCSPKTGLKLIWVDPNVDNEENTEMQKYFKEQARARFITTDRTELPEDILVKFTDIENAVKEIRACNKCVVIMSNRQKRIDGSATFAQELIQ